MDETLQAITGGTYGKDVELLRNFCSWSLEVTELGTSWGQTGDRTGDMPHFFMFAIYAISLLLPISRQSQDLSALTSLGLAVSSAAT